MAPVQLPVLSSEFPDSWDIWLRLGVPAPVEGLSPARKGGVAEVESSKRVFSTPTSGVSSRLPRIITESKRSGDTRSDECPNMPFVPRGILLREKKKKVEKKTKSPQTNTIYFGIIRKEGQSRNFYSSPHSQSRGASFMLNG